MNRGIVPTLTFALLLPLSSRSEDKPDPIAVFRGTWVCIEQSGGKPSHEIKLIVDKTGGYRMGGTGAEASDLARLGGIDGKLRIDASRGEFDFVGSKLTLPGIYKLEGQRLALLIGPRGARPTSFDKLDGTLHVFIRETEKK